MNQQTSDLPRSVQIIGRFRTLIGVMAVLGLLGGAAFAALNSPVAASRALVLFTAPSCPDGAICGGPAFSPGYIQARLLKVFAGEVQIEPVTGNVLSVSASAGTAAQAEAAAEAAARAYVADVGSLSYLGENVSARILEPATTATGTTPPKRLLGDALLGALFGALVGLIAALAGGQTIIDPVALPERPGAGEEDWEASQGTSYASTGVSLEQLALEYSWPGAAPGGPLDRSEAEPPSPGRQGR
jgi:hypothetical protein